MSHDTSPELVTRPANGETSGSAIPLDASTAAALPVPATPLATAGPESHRAHTRRMAHRTRLHLYVVAAIALLVYVVALATTNTHRVRVDWVFAHSTLPLVWLALFAAIIGWLLGTLITLAFRLRTRAPRRDRGAPAPPQATAPLQRR
jgi:uncharacterized integral membrane protein